jgi:hypothetical protein
MNSPLPSHFQLTEAELSALDQQRQVFEKRNDRIKKAVIVSCFGVLFTVFYVIVIANSDREWGFWAVIVGWIPFVLAMLLMTAGFIAAILRRLGPESVVMKPFLSAPDERIKRYQAFREAESKYQIWFQRTQEEFWNSLSGAQFELEVVQLLNRAGFAAQLTSGSGDGGVDIVLNDGTIIQCKARRGPCGPAFLRELYGSLHDFGAEKAILISREGFTAASIQFVEGKPIDLWDRNTLIMLQRGLP